jgi:hypothetical protein
MNNKTCGECKHYNDAMFHCEKFDCMAEAFNTCEDFEQKVITNGDVILQGGMRAIAELGFEIMCARCIYSTYEEDVEFGEDGWICNRPKDKDCVDGIEAWLNAPAESEADDE